MTTQSGARSGTWTIPSSVRRNLARSILELRAALEEDFRRQLAAMEIRESGIQPLAAGRILPPAEQRAREVAQAVIVRDFTSAGTGAEAVQAFVRECAFTFLNRMVGLRCLDERGLLYVEGQQETAVKQDLSRGASSLYWRVRNELPPTTNPREVWRETLRRAGAAISERIRILFDPEAEHAVLLPQLATLQRVVDVLNAPEIPSEVYAQDELLGWVYQYYQSQEKDAAYARLAKGKKLERPEELAAATCLYTERYMVDYLLQNTLGALWLEMHPDSRLPERWPYYVRPPEGQERPKREPRPLRTVTLIDPACGSGHFLVRAFDLLVEMYREEGREAESAIPSLILERNLYGIDIDARSVQIAALALYLKGCELAGPEFRPRKLNLVAADAVLPGDSPPAEYLARFKDDPAAEALVRSIWQGLKNVREFGSLLHPERAVDEAIEKLRQRERGQMFARGDEEWQRWKAELLDGLREEFERQARSEDLSQRLFGEEAAKGVSLVEALGQRYGVVVMNPPYAGSKNLSEPVRKFVEREYKEGKRDLYAAFIQRCRDFARRGGFIGMVTQQSWMFLSSYQGLREVVLAEDQIGPLSHHGRYAFDEIGNAAVKPVLLVDRRTPPDTAFKITAFRLTSPRPSEEQARLLKEVIAGRLEGVRYSISQRELADIPGRPVAYWLRRNFVRLLSA
ncbi:MAG: hypothetical protein IT307_20140, partial [Chloroflexi bacterium]|nr:hypothetical protein [Chloroflexota bacterium]